MNCRGCYPGALIFRFYHILLNFLSKYGFGGLIFISLSVTIELI